MIETLKEYLLDKQVLLVLDNFEQVIPAAPQVAEMMAAAPQVKVLATSRELLRIRSEHNFPVLPLALPNRRPPPPVEQLTQYEAVRLFIERALAVKPDFAVNNDNAPAVAEICHRLDGLPLAIELAAARIQLLSPQAMLDRLQNRLKLLTGGARDLPARQQTLRSTIEWSYDLLDEGERRLFRRLGVFQGGRTLEAIGAVCNADDDLEVDVLDGIGSLVSKSLIQQREDAGEVRFWYLETIHEYSREQLDKSGEGETTRQRHAATFLRLAEEAEPQLTGPRQAEWYARLEAEHDNFRAALAWCLSKRGDKATALRLSGALWRFWSRRNHYTEGCNWLEQALSRSDNQPAALRAKALYCLGALSRYLPGRAESARQALEEAFELFQQVGDKQHSTWTLNDLGVLVMDQGDLDGAANFFEQSLILKRELGNKWDVAIALNNLGYAAHLQGNYPRAKVLYGETLALHREAKHMSSLALTLDNLGYLELQQGNYEQASVYFKESLGLVGQLGDKWLGANALTGMTGAIAAKCHPASVAQLLGAVEAMLESVGAHPKQLDAAEREIYDRTKALARAQLDDPTWEQAWAEGRDMSMEEAVAYALEEGTERE